MRNEKHPIKRLSFKPDMKADAVIRAMQAKYPRTTASAIIRGGLRALSVAKDQAECLFPQEKGK